MKARRSLRLSFIGGGKMAEALVRGLLDSGAYTCSQIEVGEPDGGRRDALKEAYGIRVAKANVSVVSRADVCLLAVKPQEIASVLD